MSLADTEATYRKKYGSAAMTNSNMNALEKTQAQKNTLAGTLSVRGLEARVITYTGDYMKVKWYLNKKPFQTFKMKGYVQADVLAFINAAANDAGLPA